MRPILGSLAILALVASIFPATIVAASPTRASDSTTTLRCELPSEAGAISVFVEIVGTEGFASLLMWAPGTEPYEDPPSIVSGESHASLDGSNLRAGFELVAVEDGRLVGSATLGAELEPSGAPIVDRDGGRDGNILFRSELVSQTLTVAGTLTIDLLDGTHVELDLGACHAGSILRSYFATAPNAWVYGGEQLFVSCEWTTQDATISLFGLTDDWMALSQLVVVRGDTVLVGMADHVLSETTYEASYSLTDMASGETAGTATAAATLAPSGERITDHVWENSLRLSAVGERLGVDGTLTVAIDGDTVALSMDDATCTAGDVRVRTIEKMGRE